MICNKVGNGSLFSWGRIIRVRRPDNGKRGIPKNVTEEYYNIMQLAIEL